MSTNRWKALSLVAACAFIPLCASPQTPTPTPAMRATLQARHASGVAGSVSITPAGAGSKVQVQLSGPSTSPEVPTLISGSDCADVVSHSARTIALNPFTGRVSNTIVAIPFGAFSSRSFVVDVRNATTRAQQAEACARLSR